MVSKIASSLFPYFLLLYSPDIFAFYLKQISCFDSSDQFFVIVLLLDEEVSELNNLGVIFPIPSKYFVKLQYILSKNMLALGMVRFLNVTSCNLPHCVLVLAYLYFTMPGPTNLAKIVRCKVNE